MSFTNAKVAGANVSPDAYHAPPFGISRGHREYVMSRSGLMAFYPCPEKWLAGGREEDDTAATEWGKWMDAYLLGNGNEFAVTPATYSANGKRKDDPPEDRPWNRNATFCREWEDDRKDKLILKPEEWGRVKTAGDRLMADPISSELARCSKKQVMVVAEWEDEETKIAVPVKALIDLVPSDDCRNRNVLADLKTVESAHPGGWPRKAFTYHWHVQAAFYLDIYCAATGEDRNTFVNIVQESHAPFQPGHEMYSVEFVQLGRETYQSALRSYCRCLATGVWPNYAGMQDDRDKIGAWSLAQPEPWMIAKQLNV